MTAPARGGAELHGPEGQRLQIQSYELDGAEGAALDEARERLADVLEDAMLQACNTFQLTPYTPLLAGQTAGGDRVVELHSKRADGSLSQWYCVGKRGGLLVTCEWDSLTAAQTVGTLDAVRGALHHIAWG
jgi:hypothetical protein